MVAPSGARRSKADHPALPISITEVVADATDCFAAGADALHAHVRDTEGAHVLDAGLYAELIAEMARAVPDMPVQITTEAVGRYSPEEQRALVRAVQPEGVSVALREMWPVASGAEAARRFYAEMIEAGITVQHILYNEDDCTRFCDLASGGTFGARPHVLLVLGSYSPPRLADVAAIARYRAAFGALDPYWTVCAFGRTEQACLVAAAREGGTARIGFENCIERPDGTPAPSNAAQVAALVEALAD